MAKNKKEELVQEMLQKDGQWDVEKFISRRISRFMSDEEVKDFGDIESKKKAWIEAMLKKVKIGDNK